MSALSPSRFRVFAMALLSGLFMQAGGCAQAIDDPSPSTGYLFDADFQRDNLHATIFRSKLDMILDHYYIYERPDDGVLLLVDGKSLFPIAESWRLYEFHSAGWVDRKAANEIAVTASYVTGMGPTGAKPFRAKIIMGYSNGGWAPSSTVVLTEVEQDFEEESDEGDKPVKPLKPPREYKPPQSMFDRPLVEAATTLEEHQELIRKRGAALADAAVDFSTERLITATVVLTSGSIKIRDVRVHKNETGYDISYSLMRPRIGTADIKFSAIYVVLPDDGLSLSVFERGRGGRAKGVRIKAKSGVINRIPQ